jgi:hypothetical protein
MTNQQTQKGEGIYFNMSAEEYFALPYFSRSLAQKVRFSGQEAEYYINNPTKETPAMELGTALHSLFLEPEKFNATYVKAPSIFDEKFAGKKIIQTVDDLKPYVEQFGLKKSGKKEDMIESVRAYLNPAEVVIWDDVKSNFEREVVALNQKVLSNDDFTNLENICNKFNESKNLHHLLENGRSEVVIIWKDKTTGITCKCRLDYIQPDAVIDVKSFSIKDFNTPLIDQLRKKTIFSYYNLQYVIYAEALESAINAINLGHAGIHGETNQEWIDAFLKNPKKQFVILYVRTSAPYQMQALELRPSEFDGAGENTYFSVALQIWHGSLAKYKYFLKNGQWFGENEIAVLRDEHAPNIMWQQSIED